MFRRLHLRVLPHPLLASLSLSLFLSGLNPTCLTLTYLTASSYLQKKTLFTLSSSWAASHANSTLHVHLSSPGAYIQTLFKTYTPIAFPIIFMYTYPHPYLHTELRIRCLNKHLEKFPLLTIIAR